MHIKKMTLMSTKKIAQNPTSGGNAAGASGRDAPNPALKEWKLIYEAGQAPKSILAKHGTYRLSYHVYWTTGNRLIFWYAKLFHNNREIAELPSRSSVEQFLKQRGLPSVKGLPYFSEVE